MSEDTCLFEPGDIVKYSLGTTYLIVSLSEKEGDWGCVALKNGLELHEKGRVYPYRRERLIENQHLFTKLGSIDEL